MSEGKTEFYMFREYRNCSACGNTGEYLLAFAAPDLKNVVHAYHTEDDFVRQAAGLIERSGNPDVVFLCMMPDHLKDKLPKMKVENTGPLDKPTADKLEADILKML